MIMCTLDTSRMFYLEYILGVPAVQKTLIPECYIHICYLSTYKQTLTVELKCPRGVKVGM